MHDLRVQATARLPHRYLARHDRLEIHALPRDLVQNSLGREVGLLTQGLPYGCKGRCKEPDPLLVIKSSERNILGHAEIPSLQLKQRAEGNVVAAGNDGL